ncbi:MAG TPA: YkgJ family cysteine cluster protein [Methanoregulaceae archaeon]|nr:YkgJ family cysteine cluster protein [Methanoregulaceae archaeon]
MADESTEMLECAQCGVCCKIFGDSISPTIENVYQWLENGRTDILEHFSACRGDGSWTKCSDLRTCDLSEVVSIELRDPNTGGLESSCPFLMRVSRNRYLCAIHLAKPSMCDNYKPWIWGETYFRRCRTITGNEKLSFWNRK